MNKDKPGFIIDRRSIRRFTGQKINHEQILRLPMRWGLDPAGRDSYYFKQ